MLHRRGPVGKPRLYRYSTARPHPAPMDGRAGSAYALVQEIAVSWAEFRWLAAGLYDPAPAGLVVHIAGPTDEGVRVINVWESEQAWRRFQSERLEPARAALGGPARRVPTTRDLHAAQIVLGPGDRADEPDNQGGTR